MSQYLLLFVAGIAGSFHCIGMCGGFACALGSHTNNGGRAAIIARHMLYNSGRLTTYIFLGVLAGTLGFTLMGHGAEPGFSTGQRLLSVTAGLLMIIMALQILGLRIPFVTTTSAPSELVLVPLRSLLKAPGGITPLVIGVFNGFLPCPLVYAFVAKAAASGDSLSGVLIMTAFGLGTFPAMLLMGALGHRLSPALRRRGVWLAGTFILLFGLITLVRGILPLAQHGHAVL